MREKPLAMTRTDAAQMIRSAAARGRMLGVNHPLRASSVHRRIRELIESGALGRVHGVQVSHAVYLPPHADGTDTGTGTGTGRMPR